MVRGYVYNADIWASVVGKNFGIAAWLAAYSPSLLVSRGQTLGRETRSLLLSELTDFHLSHFPH